MKKIKYKNIIENIIGIIVTLIMIYMMKTGRVRAEESDETVILAFVILCLVLSITGMVKNFKRDNNIETTINLKITDLEKIRELKKKNQNPLVRKTIYLTIIILVLIFLLLSFIAFGNLEIIWILISIPIFEVIIMFPMIFWIIKYSMWYYDLDEFLYYKYQLSECINKKEKLAKMKEEIDNQKNLLKQRRKLKKIENKLLQDEELEIRRINGEIGNLINYNEYKKNLPDGSELRFSFSILTSTGSRNKKYNKKYNIKSNLYVDRENLKLAEEIEEIINKHKDLRITIKDSGIIETVFVSKMAYINYEYLIYLVSYSYEVCCKFLKYGDYKY